jgi:transcriptional regulator with XRE-family HTH domain
MPVTLTPDLLLRARLRLNYSQAEMGAALGVSGVTWGRWERGEVQPEHPPMLLYALEYLVSRGPAPDRPERLSLTEMETLMRVINHRQRVRRGKWAQLEADCAADELALNRR